MKRILLGILLAIFAAGAAFGLNIRIPSLQITTMIGDNGGSLVTQTQTEMDLLIEGGYKFGGKIVIGCDGIMGFLSNPAYGQALPPVSVKSLSVQVRDMFGVPLSLSYFIGTNDYLCYGDDFSRLFGSTYIQPVYTAYYVVGFPIPMTYFFEYRGVHRVNGNGIKLEYQSPDQPFGFMWYVYQDHNFVTIDSVATASITVDLNKLLYSTGLYSSDLRFLINTEPFKAEIFAGGTIDSSDFSGYARFGALLYAGTETVNFLLAGGLPQLDFVTPFSLDLFYILFESRINLGPISIIPSAFMHPLIYLQQVNVWEQGKIDFNLNLSVFNPRRDPVSFGVEGNFQTYNLLNSNPFLYGLYVQPYIAFATPGVFWQIKVSMQVLNSAVPMTFQDMLATLGGIISIKAEF
jgi:hypothetical protein